MVEYRVEQTLQTVIATMCGVSSKSLVRPLGADFDPPFWCETNAVGHVFLFGSLACLRHTDTVDFSSLNTEAVHRCGSLIVHTCKVLKGNYKVIIPHYVMTGGV